MRLILLTAVGAFAAAQAISGIVMAQSQPGTSGAASEYGRTADSPATTGQASDSKPGTPQADQGKTTTPETKGQPTPQGWSGPLNTQSGGAPADSPQGQSPPGMQEAPEGAHKGTVEPDAKK
jgi:hypothetical protein